MRFYGLSDDQVMHMPIRRFWMLSRMINRVAAEEDMRELMVANAAPSGESTKELKERLTLEIGTVSIQFDAPDRAGIERLKAMAG